MLTGRPPFKGATPLSTLNQVTGQEPLAPGKLQRHTPRAIETIYLKCLEKEPRKRYATALDLAEDLRRFLDGRPIQARRIGFPEWLWRWCRREPVKAGLAVALFCAFIAGAAGVTTQWLQQRWKEVRACRRRPLPIGSRPPRRTRRSVGRDEPAAAARLRRCGAHDAPVVSARRRAARGEWDAGDEDLGYGNRAAHPRLVARGKRDVQPRRPAARRGHGQGGDLL